MVNLRTLAALMAMASCLVACGSGKTTVLKAASVEAPHNPGIEIAPGDTNVPVSSTVLDSFENKLDERLFSRMGFARGRDLTIVYRVIHIEPGNTVSRNFFLGIGGKGSIAMDVDFIDREGKVVSTIRVEGETGIGASGGDFNSAVQAVARRVARHTEYSFR